MDRDLLKQQLKYTLEGTDFDDQGELYRGKVRDNYVNEDTITMVTTDRISAFDRVLGTVPFKGQALVELADWWFGETADIVANHVMRRPHPNVWTVRRCDPIQVEMVVRGYITGVTSTSAWTAYEKGDRNFCGNELPDGMRKNEKLPEPIINRAGCNLSFAGLKTAVLRESKKMNNDEKLRYSLAASFQNTINKILYKKTKIAINQFRDKTQIKKVQLKKPMTITPFN